jgi:hypothetical protein
MNGRGYGQLSIQGPAGRADRVSGTYMLEAVQVAEAELRRLRDGLRALLDGGGADSIRLSTDLGS